jgi:hypothetical protein
MGRAGKGTWGDLGRQKEELIDIEWIASNGSESVPTAENTFTSIRVTLKRQDKMCRARQSNHLDEGSVFLICEVSPP